MWIILMPFVGAAIGLIAGTASLALSAVHPTALYVVLVTAVTIGATIGLGYVVLDGFNLGGVELGFAALVGATCAHFYRRFLTSSARLAGVSRKAEFSKRGQ